VSLPWPVAAYDQACASLGPDYWSYGAHENRKVLETLARYSFEQGLSVRPLPFEEMFAASTYELTKI
jgi:4,5-dihydroxyphthalate decarboxylase